MADRDQLGLIPGDGPQRACACSNASAPDVQLYPYPFSSAPGRRLILTTSAAASDIDVGFVENHGGDFRQIGLDANAAERLAEDLQARAAALRERGKPALEALGRAVHPGPGLPEVLSSVNDVARLCEAAGLTRADDDRWSPWSDGPVTVVPAYGISGVAKVRMSGRWIASVMPGAPTALLWSAIQAARGGEHRG